jgi:DNA-directed RNA polymerase specialized sigma24 family protein
MLGTQNTGNNMTTRPQPYATSADFCRIFEKDMNRLYLLAFLLTTDHAIAENCFVEGLDDSKNGNPVFKEWAQSWARRSVITNAIRMIHPRPQIATRSNSRLDSPTADSLNSTESVNEMVLLPTVSRREAEAAAAGTFSKEIAAIITLPAFQRFAFVISVLEGFSNREASLLLDCSVHELVSARTHALEQIGGRPELHRKLAGIDATEASLAEAGAAYAKEVMSHLAVPA